MRHSMRILSSQNNIMIDRPTIERILAAANIVDVVSDFVTLKKSGSSYKGLCPFHDDTTPSFSVSPARNYCHCFTCGKGGTPVGFIMEHEQMTYVEALRWLAKKYHIEIKERELTNEEKEQESERESLFIVNEWAAKYYQDILKNDVDGRAIGMQYFRSRGFRDDIIEKFRLGFALNDRYAMPREAVRKGYKKDYLIKSGICYAREEASSEETSLVDRFYGRAIFPWIGQSGKVVGFGGRKLDKATKGVQQKYVNSPESPIYHKDRELYGIFQARRAIAKEDCVFMVEGYTDVISMHQCGIENVVANSGTALSEFQIHMLHRLTSNIVLLYDGDAAGIKAAMRGTDMLLANGMNIKVLILPDGDDPDSFARKHTAEEYREYIKKNQTDFIQFKIDVMLNGVTDPVKRSEAISSIVKSVSVIPDPIVRAAYLQDCAMRLNMAEQTLLTRMNGYISEEKKERRRRMERQNTGVTEAVAGGAADSGQPDSQPAATSQPAAQAHTPSAHYAGSGATTHYAGGAAAARGRMSVQTITHRLNDISRMILEAVVRHGEKIVKENVPMEDGSMTTLTMAEYIYYNLGADSLQLTYPIYNSILAEAFEKSRSEGFCSMQYFANHPDIEISRAACGAVQDHYILSQSLARELSREELLQHIDRLLLDYRRNIIDQKLSTLLQEIEQAKDNPEKVQALMGEYKVLNEMIMTISRGLGNRLR